MVYLSVMLGPQGAGKDTQSRLLEQQGYIKAFSVGEILRHISLVDPQIKSIVDAGALVPGGQLRDILERFFQQDKIKDNIHNTHHIILTGFPRILNQVYVLTQLLQDFKWNFGLAFILELTLNDIVERVRNRYICPTCGAIYNLKTNPPQTPGKCDFDGTPLVKRDDDIDLRTIKKRLQIFRKDTLPVIEMFKSCGCAHTFNASGTVKSINKQIQLILKDFQKYRSECKFPDHCVEYVH